VGGGEETNIAALYCFFLFFVGGGGGEFPPLSSLHHVYEGNKGKANDWERKRLWSLLLPPWGLVVVVVVVGKEGGIIIDAFISYGSLSWLIDM